MFFLISKTAAFKFKSALGIKVCFYDLILPNEHKIILIIKDISCFNE